MTATAIVGCGKSKLDGRHAACDLYTGQLFRLQLEYARRWADPNRVFILSAKWGLVHSDAWIRSYDLRLEQLDESTLEAWREDLLQSVRHEGIVFERPWSDTHRRQLLVLAGRRYVSEVRRAVSHERWRARPTVLDPLDGFGIGHRIGWLSEQLDAPAGAEGVAP